MNDLRELPICLPPAAGEALASWLDRIAEDLELPLRVLLIAAGVVPESGVRVVPRGYGVTLTPTQLADVSFTTGRSQARVAATLLGVYDGTVFDLTGLDLHDTRGLRDLAMSKWVYSTGSRLCPSCLDEDAGVWQLTWRLPWSVFCVRHACLLLGECPGCGRRFRSPRKRGSGPGCLSLVPTPVCCGNVVGVGRVQHGGPRTRCGTDLKRIETIPVLQWPRLIDVQANIDRVVAGGQAQVAGSPVSSVSFFTDLRTLVSLIIRCGQVVDLGDVPQICRDAFEVVTDERTKIQSGASANPGRTAAQLRFFVKSPRSPALMAGLLPLAHEMLAAPTEDALTERVSWLADRIRAFGRKRIEELPVQYRASPILARSFAVLAGPPAKWASRAGIHVFTRADRRVQCGLAPDCVPALYWEDRYEEHFAPLLGRMTRRSGRRFISVALVKCCGAYTWRRAGELLGYEAHVDESFHSNVVTRLNRSGSPEQVLKTLHEEAKVLAARNDHVDWGSRRRALNGFEDIDPDVWQELCATAGVQAGKGSKRRNAASWVWAEITGGDVYYAPGRGDDAASIRSLEDFLVRQVSPLREALLAYGEGLLVTAATNPNADTTTNSLRATA